MLDSLTFQIDWQRSPIGNIRLSLITVGISAEKIKDLFVDGVCFKMRVAKSVENVPVLVAIGVNEAGQRMVLGLQAGDKESATCWREFFKDLKRRTKPMEIVAGERACYTLLAFICLKMELHWRNFPMGKRASYLPVIQNLELANFTQSS